MPDTTRWRGRSVDANGDTVEIVTEGDRERRGSLLRVLGQLDEPPAPQREPTLDVFPAHHQPPDHFPGPDGLAGVPVQAADPPGRVRALDFLMN
jgi:hypothetical protein